MIWNAGIICGANALLQNTIVDACTGCTVLADDTECLLIFTGPGGGEL